MSVEMSEHRYPVRFEYLGIREDSSGAGRQRGGGGGFGNPRERDLNQGLVSRETAESVYGAVIASARPVGAQIRYELHRAAMARR